MSLTLALNMEFLGEAGVQILLGVLMECAQEKIRNRLARFARFVWFEVRDRTGTRLRYEIEPELVFGIIFGVVIQHLRIGILSYS